MTVTLVRRMGGLGGGLGFGFDPGGSGVPLGTYTGFSASQLNATVQGTLGPMLKSDARAPAGAAAAIRDAAAQTPTGTDAGSPPAGIQNTDPLKAYTGGSPPPPPVDTTGTLAPVAKHDFAFYAKASAPWVIGGLLLGGVAWWALRR